MSIILLLRVCFVLVLATMIVVTGWASVQCAIWQIPEATAKHPWFIATLFDAYFGFLTFYCWVFYKESSWVLKILWFVLIMVLGNMAMASYMLIQLAKVSGKALAGKSNGTSNDAGNDFVKELLVNKC